MLEDSGSPGESSAKVPRPDGGWRAGHGGLLLKRLPGAEPGTGPALPGDSGLPGTGRCGGRQGAASPGSLSRGLGGAVPAHLRGSRSAPAASSRQPRPGRYARGGPRSAPPCPAAARVRPLPQPRYLAAGGSEGDRQPCAVATGGESL